MAPELNFVNSLIQKVRSKYLEKKGTRKRMNLTDFLDGKSGNYHLFEAYLEKSMAIENLRFLETIIVFRNVLLAHLQDERDDDVELINAYNNKSNRMLKRLWMMDLSYLTELSDKFSALLHRSTASAIVSEIHDQFIGHDSLHCINVSSAVRQELTTFIQKYTKRQTAEQEEHAQHRTLLSYVYLDLFNDAILEIYNLVDIRFMHFLSQEKQQP